MSTRKGKIFVGAYVPAEVKAALQELADGDDRSLSYVVAQLLMRGAKAQKKSCAQDTNGETTVSTAGSSGSRAHPRRGAVLSGTEQAGSCALSVGAESKGS